MSERDKEFWDKQMCWHHQLEDAKLDFKRVDNKNYELTKEIEKLQLENKALKEQLKLAESQIDDLKQYVDELNKVVYQENGDD